MIKWVVSENKLGISVSVSAAGGEFATDLNISLKPLSMGMSVSITLDSVITEESNAFYFEDNNAVYFEDGSLAYAN